jgi:hypothetical protein
MESETCSLLMEHDVMVFPDSASRTLLPSRIVERRVEKKRAVEQIVVAKGG